MRDVWKIPTAGCAHVEDGKVGNKYLCWSISDRKKPAVDGWSKKCQQLGHGRRLLWWWGHPDLTPPLRKCFTDKKSVFLFQKFDFIHSLCPHTAEESHHQEMQRNEYYFWRSRNAFDCFCFLRGPLPSLSIRWVWDVVLRGCASSPSLIYGSLFLH